MSRTRSTGGPQGLAPSDERQRRLAAALRENLQRRKAQGRARAVAVDTAPQPPGGTAPDGEEPAG